MAKLKDVLDLSSPHMLLALVRRRQDKDRTVESVTTLYVLDHKTSVGVTLRDHYFGDSAKIDELFAIKEPCISALHREVGLLQPCSKHPVEQVNGRAHKLYNGKTPISDLMNDIQKQKHTVLGMDPDYPHRNASHTLWVSFSKAVTLPSNIFRGNLKYLYRRWDGSRIADCDLGEALDPMWTIGLGLDGISMNESQDDKFVRDLLDWQNEPPYAVRKATSKAAMVTPVKKATSKAAKVTPVKQAKSKPTKGNPKATSNAAKVTPVKQAKSKPTKGNPKATRKPTFHTFHLRFTH